LCVTHLLLLARFLNSWSWSVGLSLPAIGQLVAAIGEDNKAEEPVDGDGIYTCQPDLLYTYTTGYLGTGCSANAAEVIKGSWACYFPFSHNL
jgi:hypothetical protein